MPILLMLIIGTVVLGSFLSVKTQTSGLARDGARAARAAPSPCPPGQHCRDPTHWRRSPIPTPTDPTKFVSVQATKDVSLRRSPLPVNFLPATTTETVTMRCGG